VPPSS
jgi:hypothetical protein